MIFIAKWIFINFKTYQKNTFWEISAKYYINCLFLQGICRKYMVSGITYIVHILHKVNSLYRISDSTPSDSTISMIMLASVTHINYRRSMCLIEVKLRIIDLITIVSIIFSCRYKQQEWNGEGRPLSISWDVLSLNIKWGIKWAPVTAHLDATCYCVR